MNKMALECQNLAKIYYDGVAEIKILSEINLAVRAAEIVAIVGTSGSGKSTLLHLLGGLDQPTKGEVRIAGKEISTLTESEKSKLRNQHLGFVYQFHHLLPEFTALENVMMPLLISKLNIVETKSRAESLLDLVGLKNRLHHKIGELSGGERQRVAIVRALVTNPLCVLADEPTGNLDPKNAEKVLDLFIELQKTYQTSVVMVTHDMNIAKRAHRILALDEGRLVEV